MAVEFTGVTGQSLSVGSPSALDDLFNGGASISLWCYLHNYGGGGWGKLLDKCSSTTPSNGWMLQCENGNSTISFWHGFSTSPGGWRIATTVALNTWHHLVVTYDGSSTSNNAKIYLGGVSKSVTESGTPSGTIASDAARNLWLGNASATTNRYMDGLLDDVRMYDRILSPAEVQTIEACRGSDKIVDGLVSRWLFREAAPGTTVSAAKDLMGVADASNNGSPVYAESLLSIGR